MNLQFDSEELVTAGLRRLLDDRGPAGRRGVRLLADLAATQPIDPTADPVSSRLTMTGRPVELGFTDTSGDLRLTTEVGAPGDRPSERLDLIESVLVQRNIGIECAESLDWVRSLQAQGTLSYGAWLGVRLGDNGHDEFKFYAEIPEEADDCVQAWLTGQFGIGQHLVGPKPRVKMIGFDADGKRVEVYCGAVDQLRTAVRLLGARAGLGAEAETTLEVLDGFLPGPSRATFPTRDLGYSYSIGQPGEPVAFTLYCVASALFGDDASCHTAIRRFRDENGRELVGYDDVCRSHTPALTGHTHHGMIGLTTTPGLAEPRLAVGVAAP